MNATDADTTLEYGRPVAVFVRVLILAALSECVLWLEISRLYDIIEAQATHDELTGVNNRRAVLDLLKRELAHATRERREHPHLRHARPLRWRITMMPTR